MCRPTYKRYVRTTVRRTYLVTQTTCTYKHSYRCSRCREMSRPCYEVVSGYNGEDKVYTICIRHECRCWDTGEWVIMFVSVLIYACKISHKSLLLLLS